MNIQISFLDNDAAFIEVIKLCLPEFLKDRKFKTFTDVNEFIEYVNQPAILVIDINLESFIDGVDVFMKIKETQPICIPIYMTSQPTLEITTKIIKTTWGSDFVRKDTTNFIEEISQAIKRAEISLKDKFAATIKLNEMDLRVREKAQSLLHKIDTIESKK